MTDAISRSAVLAMTSTVSAHGAKFEVIFPDEVEQLPALDVAPVVHARWIHDINNLYGCSEYMARETMSHKKLKKFCPSCGARMDGEKHATD